MGVGASEGGAGLGETAVVGSADAKATLVPQRGQKTAPVLSVVPQRVQKAVSIVTTIYSVRDLAGPGLGIGEETTKRSMRHVYLTALSAVLLSSCKDSTAAPVRDLDAIRVSVRVEPGTVVAGQPTSVVLTLRNSIARPVEISACPIYFWVQGSEGEIVGGSNLLYCLRGSFVYQPLRFNPFESKTLTFIWLPGETQTVPAGTYDVFGWVNEPEHHSTAARVTVQASP